MSLFAFLFPALSAAIWRAGLALDSKHRPNPYPHMSRINTAQAADIIASLVAALGTTRATLKNVLAQLTPAQDDLRAYEEADAQVDAALLAAKAQLNAWAAEDAPEPEPEPTPEPEPEPEPAPEDPVDPPAEEPAPQP